MVGRGALVSALFSFAAKSESTVSRLHSMSQLASLDHRTKRLTRQEAICADWIKNRHQRRFDGEGVKWLLTDHVEWCDVQQLDWHRSAVFDAMGERNERKRNSSTHFLNFSNRNGPKLRWCNLSVSHDGSEK